MLSFSENSEERVRLLGVLSLGTAVLRGGVRDVGLHCVVCDISPFSVERSENQRWEILLQFGTLALGLAIFSCIIYIGLTLSELHRNLFSRFCYCSICQILGFLFCRLC